MYDLILIGHSLIRWLVIGFGLIATGRAVTGVAGRTPWTARDERLGLLFAVSLDIQMLLGVLLYLFLSTITTSAFGNLGDAMRNPVTRFWVIEHPALMIVAMGLAHAGLGRARRAPEAAAKHRAALIFFGLAFGLILFAMPWPFRAAARPWLPFGQG